MTAQKIFRNMIRCSYCGDVIESKKGQMTAHCTCGACTVSGGLENPSRTCIDSPATDFEELSIYEDGTPVDVIRRVNFREREEVIDDLKLNASHMLSDKKNILLFRRESIKLLEEACYNGVIAYDEAQELSDAYIEPSHAIEPAGLLN